MATNRAGKKTRKKNLSLQSKIAKQVLKVRKGVSKKVVSGKGGKAIKLTMRPELILSATRDLPEKKALHELQNLLVDKYTRDKAIDCRFPQNLQIKSNLRYANSSHGIGFDIAFESMILGEFSDEISGFLELQKVYDKHILLSNLEIAELTLKKIKEKYGYSNWYLSSKLNLFYEKGEHKAASEYRNKVMESFKDNNFNNLSEVYANYPFIRSDKGVSYERYAFSIEHQSEELSLESDLSSVDIIHFSHFYSPSENYNDYSCLIGENSTNNIIDRYLGFKRILYSCFLNEIDISNYYLSIGAFSKKIQDKSLSNIYSLFQKKEIHYDNDDFLLLKICDLYMQGDYENVVYESEKILRESPAFISINEIYIKSLIRCGKSSNLNSLMGDICNSIKDLYLNNDKRKVIVSLKKYYLRFYHCDWAYFIKLHFDKFSNQKNHDNIEVLYKFIDINSSLANPFSKIKVKCKDAGHIQFLSEIMFNSNPEVVKEIDGIDNDRKIKVIADYYYNIKNYERSVDNYLVLSKCNDFLLSEHAVSQLISCYFKTDKMDLAIHELALMIVEGKGQNLLPISDIYNYIYNDKNKNVGLVGLYERVIIAHQYFNNFGSEDGEIVSLISEDILENLNIYEPEDIEIRDELLEVFFFRYIMTPEILEKIDLFDSIEDVYIFRFFILKELISISDDSSLKNEMFKNIEKYVKETCVYEIGTGRIEVDTLSIKNELSDFLDDAFTTIKCSERQPIEDSDYSDVSNEKGTYTISSNKYFVEILDLYYQIRDVFTLSPSHGLDYFLNMNIRHGGIVNLLWGPVKTHKICYQKTDKGYFEKEQYWFNQNPYINAETKELLDSALRKFSKNLDLELQRVKSYIHINTGEFLDEDKAFNYFTDQEFVEGLARKVKNDTTIDEFLDYTLNDLIYVTENSLKDLQEHIDLKVRNKINYTFEELKKEVSDSPYKFDELMRQIKLSQREVNEKIHELVGWMTWKNETNQSFLLGSAIEAAKEMVTNLHPNRSVSVEINDNYQCLIKGEFFRKLVMVYLILFENSIVYSKKEEIIKIAVNVEHIGSELVFSVSNVVGATNCNETVEKLEYINGKINSNYISDANKEKGSGLFKIKKVISKDMRVENTIQMSLVESVFSVNIKMNEREVCE